jgi:hypothetical protein
MEYGGLRPQHSVKGPPKFLPKTPQSLGPESLLEGMQKLNCGSHPCCLLEARAQGLLKGFPKRGRELEILRDCRVAQSQEGQEHSGDIHPLYPIPPSLVRSQTLEVLEAF